MVLGLHPEWSNGRIADHVGVSHVMVADCRPAQPEESSGSRPAKRVGKDGKARAVPAAKPKADPLPDPEPDPPARAADGPPEPEPAEHPADVFTGVARRCTSTSSRTSGGRLTWPGSWGDGPQAPGGGSVTCSTSDNSPPGREAEPNSSHGGIRDFSNTIKALTPEPSGPLPP